MYKLIKTSFSTNQLYIKNNNLKPGNFELKPLLNRTVGKLDDRRYFTLLTLSIMSSSERPFPVDITIEFKGIFEFNDIEDEKNIYNFLKLQAVHIMFPYLRSIITNLTVAAMMPPIILPIVDVSRLFKNQTDSVFIN